MSDFEPTERTTLKRRAARGHYDRDTVYAILDEGLVAHVGFEEAGHVFVLPMSYGRMGDRIILHGSHDSRLTKIARQGGSICLTVTLLDGLVLGKSIMHHSMNYRSVVVLGAPREITDETEKAEALRALVEHVIPNRFPEGRPPNAGELRATAVLALPITEASAKVRSGPPTEPDADRALHGWSGVIPLQLTPLTPIPSDDVPAGAPLPDSVRRYHRPPP